MAILLEGGCCVMDMREGSPVTQGTLKMWQQIGSNIGAEAISLRILEFGQGLSPGLQNNDCDEVLFVLEAPAQQEQATVFLAGWPFAITAETGLYLEPGTSFTVDNPGAAPVVFVSAQCPEPLLPTKSLPPLTSPGAGTKKFERPPLVRFANREATPTSDRWYRVLVDVEVGSTQVTQFVGSIPPGRAPDHFHNYEEVLFILRGTGRMWAGETNTPIAAGSCVYLPRGQVHCVENTGREELRLLGVFYPAGSPSVRYEV